jgi:hypothetical protein
MVQTIEGFIMTSFTLDRLQFSYEADFLPPVLEIVSASQQLPFMKTLLKEFGLKLGDILLNPQSLSRNMIAFRKWLPSGGSFDVTLGTDGLSFNYYSPASIEDAWEPVLNIINAIKQSADLNCEKQVLKFLGHCAPGDVKAKEFIAGYNIFEADMLLSKGLTYTFAGPPENAQTFLVMNESAIIPDGLFVMSETTYGPFTEDVFEPAINYLTRTVFPAFGLEILSGEQKNEPPNS